MSEKISIVRRLRLEANALGEFQAYASRDYGKMLLDAADEIERLRERLRLANIECFNTTAEVAQLRVAKEERDEARRERDEARASLERLTSECAAFRQTPKPTRKKTK